MDWCVVSVPPSVKAMLSKVGAGNYSKPQTLMAILDWFTEIPPVTRVRIVQEYVWQLAQGQEGRTGRADGGTPARTGAREE